MRCAMPPAFVSTVCRSMPKRFSLDLERVPMTSHKAGHDAEKIRPGIRMTTEIRPLPAFEYLTPSSVIEALAALETHGEAAKLLSGGTDLLLRMKKQKSTPSVLVDLNGISEWEFLELWGRARAMR